MDKVTTKTIGDTICRVHKTADFTMLSNGFIRSTNISCQAIALLAMVMGLPKNWNFTVMGLKVITNVGETAVRNVLKELEGLGYLVRTKLMPSKETGGRIKYVYDFYEYSAKDTSVPQYDVVMETYTADNATLYKVKKDSHFTVISNKLLRSKKLNLKQKGLLLKVLSLPNTWKFSVSGIVAIGKEGKSAIKARLAELTELGYLVRTKLNSNESKNHGFEYIYEFFEIALSKEDAEKKSDKTRKSAKKIAKNFVSGKTAKKAASGTKKQDGGFRAAENPNAETPQAEKQGQSNTNEKIQKKKKFSDSESINPSASQSSFQQSFQQSFNNPSVESDDGLVAKFRRTCAEVRKKAEQMGFSSRREETETERYERETVVYTDIVKRNIRFFDLGNWLDGMCDDDEDGFAEAEEIVAAIVRQIVSTKPYEVIHGQKFPRSVVKSVMLKANIYHIENVIQQMKEVLNIRNYEAYLISSLYNEVISYNFKKNAESRAISYDVKQRFGF